MIAEANTNDEATLHFDVKIRHRADITAKKQQCPCNGTLRRNPIAVGVSFLTHMYGPAVRCKRLSAMVRLVLR
jgi:hypothetical protein